MTGRPLALCAVNGHRAAASPEATQGHTAAHGLASSLQRIADLHAALSAAYGDLAAEAEAGLAVLAPSSVHASVPRQPQLLTPTEVAERLQVHPRTLRRMELAGEIPPAIGEGKAKRWRRADLDRWEDGRK